MADERRCRFGNPAETAAGRPLPVLRERACPHPEVFSGSAAAAKTDACGECLIAYAAATRESTSGNVWGPIRTLGEFLMR